MMTALEWLRANFKADDERFTAAEAGDFARHGFADGTLPTGCVQANIDLFLSFFGDTIGNALATHSSIYQALTDGTVQDRGWRPYFDLWKAKGIIS